MAIPTSPRTIRERLEELGVSPRKSRGQNFLCDRNTIDRIVNFAHVEENDTVIEIGPGLGAISEHLFAKAGSYAAIELEPHFQRHILESLEGLLESRVINADVRYVELPLSGIVDPPYVVVSNVPYSVSTDVTLWLIRFRSQIKRASLLLQREFAERLAASPGGKEYGSLTVLRTLYADARLGPTVPGTVFLPPADVESRLLELTMLSEPRFPVPSQELFERVVRAGFSTRRKTLHNAIASGLGIEKAESQAMLLRAGIDPSRRAETLSLEEFCKLSWEAVNLPK